MKINRACAIAGTVILALLPASVLAQFTYVANQESANVSGYAIHPGSGVLTRVSGSPFASGVLPWSVTLDPTGRFAYVVNQGGGVFGYAVNARTGVLAPLTGSPWPTGTAPESVAVDPTGRFAYVANYSDNTISGYEINSATGELTKVSGSPFLTGSNPDAIAVHPSGKFVYAANFTDNNVSGYALNPATGALARISGSPFTAGVNPASITFDPEGKFAYVANNGGNVSAYKVTATSGALEPISGSPFTAGSLANFVAVDPTGRFAYVANYGDDNLSGYTINASTGALTQILGSPWYGGPAPAAISVDPTGAFAYVPNNYSGAGVTGFTIDPVSGALSSIGSWSAGSAPYSVAVRPIIPLAALSVQSRSATERAFTEDLNFTAGDAGKQINPPAQAVFLTLGKVSITFPPGSFRASGSKDFVFSGSINDVKLSADIHVVNATHYTLSVTGSGVDVRNQPQPMTLGLQVGPNAGATRYDLH